MRMLTSTRSEITASDMNAVLQGIASDGGLFVDPKLDSLTVRVDQLIDKDSFDISSILLGTLLPSFTDPLLLVKKGYSGKFSCGDIITPVVSLSDDISFDFSVSN